MSNVAIDLTKTVKEIITAMKTAIDNLNTDVSSNKTAIDNLKGQVLQAVYPVGSVYVSITDSRDPADILGFGTWEALPAGYGLVAQGTATAEDGSTLTFTAGQKSGEFKHQITIRELPPKQKYTALCSWSPNWQADPWGVVCGLRSGRPIIDSDRQPVAPLGDGEYHNNIPPYVACYLWKRVS